ncbi:MAG: uracil-DNA glycosylase [Desulfatiglandaceae bacterium]
MLSTKDELREIFADIKALTRAYADLGVFPPPVSADTLRFVQQSSLPAMSGHREGDPDTADRTEPGAPHDPPPQFVSLEALSAHVGECQRCPLHKNRNKLVFGEGPSKARLVFIGEGPGADEDMVGRPFVGKAGKLLTRIIEDGMGLNRQAVYICNIVKCHPPGNRDPKPEEIEACIPFLKHQINIIRPEVICTLGRVAAQALFGQNFKITLQRGHWQDYQGIPAMPTFHPAYLLRYPDSKRQTWEDIKQVMERLGLEIK